MWPTGHHLLTPELKQERCLHRAGKQDLKLKRSQLASVWLFPPTEDGPGPLGVALRNAGCVPTTEASLGGVHI